MQDLRLVAETLAQAHAGDGLGQHDHAICGGSAPPALVGLERAAERHHPTREPDQEVTQLCRWGLEHELRQLGSIDKADGAHADGELARRGPVVHGYRRTGVAGEHRTRPPQDVTQLAGEVSIRGRQ